MTTTRLRFVLLNLSIFLLFGLLPNLSLISDQYLFDYPKVLLVYLFAIIFFGVLSYSVVKSITYSIRIRLSSILICIWLLILLLSTVFSQSAFISFLGDWNTQNRGQGFLMSISFLLIFLYFRQEASRGILLKVLFVTSLGAIYNFLWGVINQSGLAYFRDLPLRMSSLEFNTIDHANYLSLALPASIVMFFVSKTNLQKLVSLIGIFILTMGIVLSLTRGAWISILTVFILMLRVVYLKGVFRLRIIRLLGFGIIIFLIVGLYYIWPVVIQRVKETVDPSIYNSINIRILEYQAGFNIFASYPVLGSGPDTIRIVYPRFRFANLNSNVQEWNQQTTFLRSYYLQILATTGVFGFVIFLGLIYQIFHTVFNHLKNLSLVFFGIFFVWLIIVVSFIFYGASIGQLVFFWGLGGLMLGLQKNEPFFVFNISGNSTLLTFKYVLKIITAFLVLILIILLLLDGFSRWVFWRRLYAADRDGRLVMISKAIHINPFNLKLRHNFVSESLPKISQGVQFMKDSSGLVESWINDAEDILKVSESFVGNDPSLKNDYSLLLLQKVRLVESERKKDVLQKAVGVTKELIRINPTSPEALDNLTMIYLAMEGKNLKDAEIIANKSIKVMPLFVAGYHHLAESLKQQGRFQEAVAVYQDAIKIYPEDAIAPKEIEKIIKLKSVLQ